MANIWATGRSGTIGQHLPPSVQNLEIDLTSDYEEFKKLSLAKDDIVIHLAAIVGEERVTNNPEHSYAVNVEGSRKLAKICLQRNVGKLIYASTAHVYSPSSKLLKEDSPILPKSVYAQQKYQGERFLLDLYTDARERLCIARIFSILDFDVQEFTLGGRLKKIVKGNLNLKIRCADDVRDFQTPTKTAELLYKVATKRELHGVINICTGMGTTVKDAVKKMLTEQQYQAIQKQIDSGVSEVPYIVGDASHLKEVLKGEDLEWKPSVWLS